MVMIADNGTVKVVRRCLQTATGVLWRYLRSIQALNSFSWKRLLIMG